MRRTALITAFASIASLALAAAPADATSAPSDSRLVATASCQGGGQATLVSTVDAAGAEHAAFSASGVRFKHWSGQLLPDGDATAPPADGTTVLELVAKHGRFSTGATRTGAGTLDASASFVSGNKRGTCTVATTHDGSRYELVSAVGDLSVQGSSRRGLVQTEIRGKLHHKYRVRFTAKTSAGVKHWKGKVHTLRTGLVPAGMTTSRSRDIGSFTKLSVTFTDRTAKHAAPIHLSLGR